MAGRGRRKKVPVIPSKKKADENDVRNDGAVSVSGVVPSNTDGGLVGPSTTNDRLVHVTDSSVIDGAYLKTVPADENLVNDNSGVTDSGEIEDSVLNSSRSDSQNSVYSVQGSSAESSECSSFESSFSESDCGSSSSDSSMSAEAGASVHRFNVFDGNNFEEWSIRLKWGLIKEGLEMFTVPSDIEREYRRASENDRVTLEKFKKFRRKNAKAMCFIFDRLTSRVLMRVKDCSTANEVLNLLLTLYKVSSDVGRDTARLKLTSLRFCNGDNMEDYIELFERAANQFRSMGGDFTVTEELELFRTSLPGSYDNVRDWFSLLNRDEKTYENLKRKCLEKYAYAKRDSEINDRDINVNACGNFNSRKPFDVNSSHPLSNRECYSCGKVGHYSRNCRAIKRESAESVDDDGKWRRDRFGQNHGHDRHNQKGDLLSSQKNQSKEVQRSDQRRKSPDDARIRLAA